MDIDFCVNETLKILEKYNISFKRGNPEDYFNLISRVSYGLTLPTVPERFINSAIILKNIYTLWNIWVDDEIDNGEGNSNLLLSIKTLNERKYKVNVDLMSELINPFQEEFLRIRASLDLAEIMNGFLYEYYINETHLFSTYEYGELSTKTASINYYLDVDILFSNSKSSWTKLPILREAYSIFGKSIKYASDIGSLEREVRNELNLNSVIIHALENSYISLDDIYSTQNYSTLLVKLSDSITFVKNLSSKNLDKGMVLINKLDVDVNVFKSTVKSIVSTYLSQKDPFFLK